MDEQPCLFLLGPPRLDAGGRPVATGLKRAIALLAFLAVTGQPQARDRLATLLWPDEDDRTARGRLRRTLHELNSVAGVELVAVHGDALAPAGGLGTDLDRFHALAASADPEDWARAAAFPADEFMSGFALDGSPEFEGWLRETREGLRQSLGSLLGRLADAHEAAGRLDAAIAACRRRLGLDPLQEPVHRRLMGLYAAASQPAAALRQYEALATLLADELGTEPDAETRAAFRRIGGSPTTDPAETAADTGPAPPATRYVTSQGLMIAYQVFGDGPVDLVLIPGFVSHLDHAWKEPSLAGLLRALGRHARVIVIDRRGLGLSERVAAPATLDDTLGDITTVMDAAGSRSAVLMGCSEGGPFSAYMAATVPERVRGLILYGTLAKGCRSEDYPHAPPAPLFDRLIERIAAGWGRPVTLDMFAPSRAHDPALQRWFADLLRLGSTPAGLRLTLSAMRDADVRPHLGRVRCPALVIHRAGDRMLRVGCGHDLAARIRGSRMLEAPGDDHLWWVGETGPVVDAIGAFIDHLAQIAQGNPRRSLAAILAAAVPIRAEVEAATLLAAAGGRIMTAAMDGPLMAAFEGVSQAWDAAGRLRARVPTAAIALDLGECADSGTDLTGPPVEGAVRLLSGAAAGAIRPSPLVAALVPTSQGLSSGDAA